MSGGPEDDPQHYLDERPPPETERRYSITEELLGPRERADPWAHRRGEPRIFAFCWTLFILVAIAGSVLWVAKFASVTSGAYGPAGRIMLVVVAVGATMLWPMVRLSQLPPPRPVVMQIAVDAWIVLLPIQMVLWPLVLLANWPLNVVAGVASVFVVWVVLVGGLLANALTGPTDRNMIWRTVWMVGITGTVLAAPMVALALRTRGVHDARWVEMLSPLTSIANLTGRGMSGPQNPVSQSQWSTIAAIGGAGLFAWITAFVRERVGSGGQRA